MIDAYASQSHYAAHITPIWWSLPPERRGVFWVSGGLADQWPAGKHVKVGAPPPSDRLTMVAGWFDELIDRPLVYVEHGAGQTYPGDETARFDPSYHGSAGHDRVRLFLCPSERVADRWRAAYPGVAAAPVGCPRLDRWHTNTFWTDRKVVAVTFHHDSQACPETRSAAEWYMAGMAAAAASLRAAGWKVLGHWHPRLSLRGGGSFGRLWRQAGVEPVASADEVFVRASVLCADNTSLLPEFASTGRPVVFLNCPGYRRDVWHGGRFWDWPEGQISCDTPAALPGKIREAHEDPVGARLARRRMVDDVYVTCDGKASLRAVEAIGAVL